MPSRRSATGSEFASADICEQGAQLGLMAGLRRSSSVALSGWCSSGVAWHPVDRSGARVVSSCRATEPPLRSDDITSAGRRCGDGAPSSVDGMRVTGLDHIVLCVADVERSLVFYRDVLGMEPREERPGKWSLHFGIHKISLQDVESAPDIARATLPGSGNFCLLTDDPVSRLVDEAEALGLEILAGPVLRQGATGEIRSVYFKDPDGNLVEISNQVV